MNSQNERNNQSNKFDRESMVKKYTNMSSRNILNNTDLKSRLARFGINNPITNTTRNVLLKKLLKLEMDSQNERKNQSNEFNCKLMLNKYTIMSSSNILNDADLKSRLARFGISSPITSTTRNILLKKLLKLEMDSQNERNNQSNKFDCESMDTTTNDLNEYEIRDGISKYGLKPVPLTDSTRPVISSIIRKKNEHS
ncbi:CAR1 transcription factor-like isoform X2 [Aphis gossypii]|nr:CAR1 transcription factor-like isoform X2 [Aphis gossypii]